MQSDLSQSVDDCANYRAMKTLQHAWDSRDRRRILTRTRAFAICVTVLLVAACATTRDGRTSADGVSSGMYAGAPLANSSKPYTPRDGLILKADTRSRSDSSFNAAVLDHASEVNSSFSTSADPRLPSLTRLESNWTRNFDDSDERLKLGDTVSSSGTWGSAIRYAGLQFGTGIDVRSDLVTSGRLATPGLAALPSAADALLGNAPGSQSLLARERWSTAGSTRLVSANTVSFIAQDALGRTQVVTRPLVPKTQLADPGCNGFSVGLGKAREDYALQSNQYGPWFANTTVRCGVSPTLTVEGHGEYLDGQTAALGVDLAQKVGTVGLASAAIASSRGFGESGWLARFGFDHTNSLFDLALRTRLQSRGFREVSGTDLVTDPVVQQTLASLGVKLSDANNLALAYATQTTAVGERADVLAVTQSMYMGAYGSLSMTAGHSVAQGQDASVYLFFTRPFGANPTPGTSWKGIATPNFDLALRTSGLPTRSSR